MKKALLVLLIPFFALAQTNSNREYWQTNKWKAKSGRTSEFKAGVAKKTRKFNNTPETSMATYQLITGADQGKFMRVMGNRSAVAFDADNTVELSYWDKHVTPHVDHMEGNKRWWRMNSLSQNWDNTAAPARFIKMTTYTIKSSNRSDFFRFWRNNNKLQKSLGYTGTSGLFTLVSGGEAYELLEVKQYNSHTEGLGKMTDPNVDYVDAYNKMFGWRTHRNDELAFKATIEKGGITIETAELKPEMSSKLK
ncbi:MAG: hypothetical protein ACI6PN_10235 [Polaribacter sp.]|uniref:hypothetical protein n=1 Tax=Polaribacter sp. TaxID=1920175 RepID=UPI00384AC6CB